MVHLPRYSRLRKRLQRKVRSGDPQRYQGNYPDFLPQCQRRTLYHHSSCLSLRLPILPRLQTDHALGVLRQHRGVPLASAFLR